MSLLSILLVAGEAADKIVKEAGEAAGWASQFAGMSLDKVIEKIISSAVDFALKLLVAAVVFYVGKFIINRIHKSVKALMIRRSVDQSLSTFILSLLKVVMLFILIIIVISILGIETSSFIALFASAGVAIGMALSGTLQNFAGGVLILLLKPYKVGDVIETQGFTGTVKEIQIFNTVLNTPDNKSIFIPNGGLSTGSINNYSHEAYRRVEWTVGISYGDDYDAAKAKILELIATDDRIVKGSMHEDKIARQAATAQNEVEETTAAEEVSGKRAFFRFLRRKHREYQNKKEASMPHIEEPDVDCTPFVALSELAASSVDIKVRVWVPTQYYWGVYFDLNEKFYKELPRIGVSFPFPQMDVHVVN